jgi:hypothetical protein
MAFEREAIERLTVEAIFLRHHLGTFELAEGFDAVPLLDPVAERADANAGPLVQDDVGEHIGARVTLSAPAAMTMSCVPDITACAANCTACCGCRITGQW